MAEITIKFDPTVDIEEIKMPLQTPTPDEDPMSYELGEYQQTRVEGIAAPLVRLNDIVIFGSQIKRFELKTNPLPTVNIDIDDTFELSRALDSPRSDNLLVVQILPPFDNGYKKVNLRFYITKYQVLGRTIRVHGVYNVKDQHDIVLEAFGQKSTYEIAELVAQRLKLGLASNIDSTTDARWMYCPSKELLSVVGREVPCGGSDTQILDWWVDYWNYLNIVDVYERYNAENEHPKIWTMTTNGVEMNETNTTDPVEVDAVVTNHPSMNGTPLYISDYKIVSRTSANITEGTDKTIETYSMSDLNSEMTDVVDGDVHNDIFRKYEYAGEVFGTHNYLIQSAMHNSFFQKINSQTIEIELSKPQLGLMRGGKVNLNWYECSDFLAPAIEEQNSSIPTNSDEIDTADANQQNEDMTGNQADTTWTLNKTISGQYYILDSWFKYDNLDGMMNWHHMLRLSRPADTVFTYLEILDPPQQQQQA